MAEEQKSLLSALPLKRPTAADSEMIRSAAHACDVFEFERKRSYVLRDDGPQDQAAS